MLPEKNVDFTFNMHLHPIIFNNISMVFISTKLVLEFSNYFKGIFVFIFVSREHVFLDITLLVTNVFS